MHERQRHAIGAGARRNVKPARSRAGLHAAMLALLACTGAATLHAQSVVRVLDVDSLPIPFALVQVSGGAERLVDSLGRARFGSDLGRSPMLLVRRLGYAPFHGRATASDHGEFVVLLEPAARTLETVRAVAARSTPLSRTGFYDRMQRVQRGAIVGYFVTPEELERRRPTLISQALQGVPSVTVMRRSMGRATGNVVLGRGRCPMTVLLDGHRVHNLLQGDPSLRTTSINPRGQYTSGGSMSIDEIAMASEVMAIEVYHSTANAPHDLIPLSGDGSCGIVAIWTGARQ